MFIATVIASAGILQAAQIGWNAGGGSGLGTDAYIYAMTGSASDYTAVLNLLSTGGINDFQSYYNGLDHADTGTYGANSHVALGAGATVNGMFTYSSPGAYGLPDSFAGGSVQNVFFVILDASTVAAANNYSVSVLLSNTLPPSGTQNYAATWAAWGGPGVNGNGTWMPIIPEPTTMVVMAAGIAALGLRRRFRK